MERTSYTVWGESARLVTYTILLALGATRPGAKMDVEDGLKLGEYMTGATLFDDYAIKQVWYKRSLMPLEWTKNNKITLCGRQDVTKESHSLAISSTTLSSTYSRFKKN